MLYRIKQYLISYLPRLGDVSITYLTFFAGLFVGLSVAWLGWSLIILTGALLSFGYVMGRHNLYFPLQSDDFGKMEKFQGMPPITMGNTPNVSNENRYEQTPSP
tara:strand:+ start:2188 stop:2499 length:312 start_codon:yes stop_codon:yes gene_type:complete